MSYLNDEQEVKKSKKKTFLMKHNLLNSLEI